MLNNIGLPGLILLLVIIGLPIFLILRSGGKKAAEQKRIADAIEAIAKSKKAD
jgi:hypothetical protein